MKLPAHSSPTSTNSRQRDTRRSGIVDRMVTFFREEAMIIAGFLLFAGFSATSSVFPTLANAQNILRQAAPTLVLGIGMTLVVLVGGIDLSVGSIVIASATAAGIALQAHAPGGAAMAIALGIGAGVGAVNAALIEGLRISPVIVTLGSMIAVRGLALVALGQHNSWINIDAPAFNALAMVQIAGIPFDALLAFMLAIMIWVALHKTIYGRRLYAVGDNAIASRLCGLPIRGLRSAAYIGCGALAGVCGILAGARTGVVSPSIGVGQEFFAIAVVALGAGGLPAGRAKVGQTVVGALILTMVFNYMTIRGIPATWQTTTTGILLLAAMVAGRLAQGKATSEIAVGVEASGEGDSRLGRTLGRYAIAFAALFLAAMFAIINPRFATLPNLITLIEQNAAFAIVAVGAMIGIVSRCIDISPGSVAAFGAVAAALVLHAGFAGPVALIGGILACLIVYGFNGIMVGRLGLDPLVVTLAAWIWARGLSVSLTGARTIPFDPKFVGFMNTPVILGFTPAVVLVVLAFAFGWLVLARLPIGIRLYGLGSDPRMLRQAGVNDHAARFLILIVMGCFTAAGMAVMLGRLGAAAPTAGFGLELDAIVAVVIGGASFRGGEGRLRDTAIGVIFLAVINNGLSGLQMGDAGFFLIKGSTILAALMLRSATRLIASDGRHP
jgi:ribose/xylose/arabinose/galactoside ABC-type transport system permease subunit